MPTLNINIPDANETTKGIAEIATQAETDAGTDDTKIVTPSKLSNYSGLGGTDSLAILYGNFSGQSLVDGTTYYLGYQATMGGTVNAFGYIPLPSGTVTAAYIQTYNAGTFGSSEDLTLKLVSNNGAQTDTLSTTVKANARHFNQAATGLSISITAEGSYLQLEVPTMTTNPNSFQLRVNLIIEI